MQTLQQNKTDKEKERKERFAMFDKLRKGGSLYKKDITPKERLNEVAQKRKERREELKRIKEEQRQVQQVLKKHP